MFVTDFDSNAEYVLYLVPGPSSCIWMIPGTWGDA
jgi:hypothetical protein